jgi:hypothetical protein
VTDTTAFMRRDLFNTDFAEVGERVELETVPVFSDRNVTARKRCLLTELLSCYNNWTFSW